VRTLSATLLAAQKAASGQPLVQVFALPFTRNIRHYSFGQRYSGAETDNPHDAVADNTYLHRVMIDGGYAKYQRGATYNWGSATWTNLSTAGYAPTLCAIAAVNNTRVIVAYNRPSTTGFHYRESTDQGATFGAEQTLTATIGAKFALTLDYRNAAGDLVALYTLAAGAVYYARRTGGGWSGNLWTNTAASITGIHTTYNGDFHVLLTGTQTTTLNPTLWGCTFGDGYLLTTNTWSPLHIIEQADPESLVTFQAPFLDVLDTHRATYVEAFTGTPAYHRTYWTAISPSQLFESNTWMDPVPIDNETEHGLRITPGANPNYNAFLSRPASVQAAPSNITQLDMTANLIHAQIHEEGLAAHGRLVFDNSAGQYKDPAGPLALHHDLDIRLGYGAEASQLPTQAIVNIEHTRHGGLSTLTVHTRGVDLWLHISRHRHTRTLGLSTLKQIAIHLAGRAGIELIDVGASTRATTFQMNWTIHPDQDRLQALTALLDLMPDVYYYALANTMYLFEPTPADAVAYTYGADHAILQSRTRQPTRPTVAEIIAPANVVGQAFDFDQMDQDKPTQDRRRDPHATTAAHVADHADARIRKAILEQDLGTLTAPTNCGLELQDVIAYDDQLVSATQIKARVRAITTTFDRRPGHNPAYQQTVQLGGL
jgi:hypothetical protein